MLLLILILGIFVIIRDDVVTVVWLIFILSDSLWILWDAINLIWFNIGFSNLLSLCPKEIFKVVSYLSIFEFLKLKCLRVLLSQIIEES